ncbi:nucleotidyltransferase domain-containing protein [Mesobacillus selenatarsenatis]|uniref:Cyclic GMP-AMP synthase n=1 Tax=Mesobacillus selenatarsenatis (strain DSM 18680 / JCM 14380 / FERM P-15431 / SF-1) TaxID=1321606 RepID=A0A0A8X2V9_MESS1|nr:nucleotidyltransferase [Mesobacillus selenatarsenatis]GAM14273.1 hypothetical protein SAMD00020551_2422 [Mesobacillus selenatarsenatis SF-1]
MVLCQTQFISFHEAIKLKEENEELASKREIILKRLRDCMPEEAKSFDVFTQGSYAMNTGIKPLDGDFDIDVGLWFDMSREDAGPVEAKEWVFKALEGHTKDVKMKTPCVTVTYAAGYHVDVTVYSATNENCKVYLAKGKTTSKREEKYWDESNPKDLIKEIRDHLTDKDDRRQFRRVVRYLKRWKDVNFKSATGKPSGIALTSCVYHWLDIQKDIDLFNGKVTYRDLDALISLIRSMISRFQTVYEVEGGELVSYPRINVELPVSPWPNLFELMTNKQMVTFKEKLECLLDALEEAKAKSDPTDACEILRKQFGDDFPVPPRPMTGKRSVAPAVLPSTESA